MTASELEQLLVTRLVRERGGTSQTWRRALGKVIVRDAKTHPHCNWEVRPSGTDMQCAAIESVLDDVRLRYAIVAVG
ncbi:hypothetical protein HT136_13415 [Novosphingobium profundi]|uniref:hypothetical protein n=1 Tax=Novosphingobium profundi TaxID=1774954 RepID=UPI001BDA94DE|nr:hypothetical protein [Novosphingobium profundi]MBT0669364.1 hypothetical protein [Novosphingobium profundi]